MSNNTQRGQVSRFKISAGLRLFNLESGDLTPSFFNRLRFLGVEEATFEDLAFGFQP
jgi:hypothetical protein